MANTPKDHAVEFPQPNCPILSLPDEVMLSIFEDITHHPGLDQDFEDNVYYNFHHHVTCIRDLVLVCRRFRRLATPFLYSHLAVGHPSLSEMDAAGLLLHRTLKENPALRPLCNRLAITVMRFHSDAGPTQIPWEVVVDLQDWLGATVKNLRIAGCFKIMGLGDGKYGWDQVRMALHKMTSLERLTLRDDGGLLRGDQLSGIDLDMVYDMFGTYAPPSLRELRLQGVRRFWPPPLPPNHPLAATARSKIPAPKTANFTELVLCSFKSPVNTFADLVRWPARLEKLTVEGWRRARVVAPHLREIWSHAMVHSQCLTSLRVGNVSKMSDPDRSLNGVDFSYFVNLVSLSLSSSVTGSNGDHAGALVAPHLEVFEWTLHADRPHGQVYLDTFGWKEEEFLRRFARAAIAQQPEPRALRDINVHFTPDPEFDSVTGRTPMDQELRYWYQYPWDRLDRVADEIQPKGLELTYSPPTMTKLAYELYHRDLFPG